MSITLDPTPPTELDIFRRIVDAEQPPLSVAAAESQDEQRRMNQLAERNRKGQIKAEEEEELNTFIRVGQLLGVLQSKARQSLKAEGRSRSKGSA